MKAIFMGTPAFAVPSLAALIASDIDVVAVITQPDRRRGRGLKVQRTPVAELADQHEIPVFQWARLNDESYQTLKSLAPDLCVVVAYGKILPKRYLDLPTHGCWNVHASLLPLLRGAAPIQWSLIEGFGETGVSLMQLDVGMDTGDVALQRTYAMKPSDNAQTLHDELSILGAEVLSDGVTRLMESRLEFKVQEHDDATHARMLTKEDGHIDFQMTSGEIFNRFRGLFIWPGCTFAYQEERIKILACSLDERTGDPGTVLSIDADGVSVACAKGALRLSRVQRPSRGSVSALDWARASSLEVGSTLR